jgi:hypothetical protein
MEGAGKFLGGATCASSLVWQVWWEKLGCAGGFLTERVNFKFKYYPATKALVCLVLLVH